MASWTQDLRFGARALRKDPRFTVVAVLIVALGIGGNAAVFSLVKKVLLDSLPFADPDRLVLVWDRYDPGDAPRRTLVSALNYSVRKAESRAFEAMGALEYTSLTLTGHGEPELLSAVAISHDVPRILGTEVLLGRSILPEEDLPGQRGRVVLISHGVWERRYGGDPELLGTTLVIDGEGHTLVGIVRPGARTPFGEPDLWIPLGLDTGDLSTARRQRHHLVTVGRLGPGVELEPARAELATIAARLAEEYPDSNAGWDAQAMALREYLVGDLRPRLVALQAASVFVLLIVCANLANLLLVRAERHGPEMAVRAALGATRGGLLRRSLIESLLLAIVGGAAGVALAFLLLRHPASLGLLTHLATSARAQPDIFSTSIALDADVLGFSLLVTLVTGLAFGLAPALGAFRSSLFDVVGHDRRAAGSMKAQRLFYGLAVAETALAMILVFGAVLMLRSFAEMQRIPLGFDERDTLVMGFNLSADAYPEAPRRTDFAERVLERVEALPGVVSAGLTTTLPVRSQGIFGRFNIRGRPPASDSELLYARYALVSPGTLQTLGIPLIRGRYPEASDDGRAAGAVVISRSMAELYWGGEDPVGRQIQRHQRPHPDKPWLTVVGVVEDVVYGGIAEGAEPAYYLPYPQHAATRRALSLNLLVRTDSDPEAHSSTVRDAVRSVDPTLPIPRITTLREMVSEAFAEHRSSTFLISVLAGFALLLGMVGLYGVTSYFVHRRAREIAVRMSVGATSADILRQVLGRGMALAAAGLFLGGVGAAFLSRFLEAQLYEVGALDPLSFAAAGLGLAAVALTANYLPARRAARTDPTVTLRYE